MRKGPTQILAEAIAALDGYYGENIPSSYDREAQEILQRIKEAGYTIEPIDRGPSL